MAGIAAILLGLLVILLGLSMFFFKSFWWTFDEVLNQVRGLVSKRTEIWEIGMNFTSFILISGGLILMYFGTQMYQIELQPVVPAVCSVVNSDLSAKNKVQDTVKIGCAAAQKKEYRTAVTNFKEALNIKNRINNSQNTQIVEPTDFDLLYAINQMERQSKK
jgi:hypothetical protein